MTNWQRLRVRAETRPGAAISEPLCDELPNRSEARTSTLILIAPLTGCKLEVGRRVLFQFCFSRFNVVGVDVTFVYAAVAGEAKATAAMSAEYLAAGECTGMRRSATVKPPTGKGPTGKPKTVVVIESAKKF